MDLKFTKNGDNIFVNLLKQNFLLGKISYLFKKPDFTVIIGKKLVHFLMAEPFNNCIIDFNTILINNFRREDGH